MSEARTYRDHWSRHPDQGAGIRAIVDLLVQAEYDLGSLAWELHWNELRWLADRPQIGSLIRRAIRLTHRPADRHVSVRWLAGYLADDSKLVLDLLDELALRSPARARSLLRRALMEIAQEDGAWGKEPFSAVAQKLLAGWPAPGACPQCGEQLSGYFNEEGDNGTWTEECIACDYISREV